jgi:hypothetical protein
MPGRRIGTARHVQDRIDDLPVVPAGREFGLARLPGSVPMPAAGRIAVQDVRRTLGSDAERIDVRPVPSVDRVPPRTADLPIRRFLIAPDGLAMAARSAS